MLIHQPHRTAPFWCLAGLALVSGCNTQETLEEKLSQAADLPAAMASDNAPLRGLVDKVVQSSGTPRQLDRPVIEGAGNAATALRECFSDTLRGNLIEQAEWLTSPAAMAQIFEQPEAVLMIRRHGALLEKLEAASDRPRCAYQVGHVFGYFGRLQFINDTAIVSRLLLLRGCDAARSGEAPRAMHDVERSLRWAGWLSRVKRLEARVLAATLREEVLSAVGVLLEQGNLRGRDAEQLYGLLRDQLANWPSDRRMLVGDRAAALHAYEVIRLGLASRLLTSEEQQGLERQGLLKQFLAPSAEDLDQDEVNYLLGMQAMIESADKGAFYDRIQKIETSRDLASEEPNLFADRFFLADVAEGLRAAARDRTRCEAWSIALATAAELRLPSFRVIPTTGQDYEVRSDASRVTVLVGDPAIADPSCPKL